jgi:two-component system, response regulator YesN
VVKVLIVDDDSIARTNIKTLIDWNKYGFEICSEAANGESSIEIIKELSPDIVITDMSMPVMNGVELIDYIEKNYPNIKVIALSGYDEYDYVRQSMKKGAVDYILKHTLNAEALINVLRIACDMINKEKAENDNRSKIQKKLMESISIMQQKFIQELVSGGFDEIDEIKQKISELGLILDTNNLAVVAVEIDDFKLLKEKLTNKGVNKIISSFTDISTDILNDMSRAIITNIEDEKFIIIFSLGNIRSSLTIHNYITASIDRIKTSIKRYLNITACFSISGIIENIMNLSKHYSEADKVLKEKFFKGKDMIFQKHMENNTKKEILNLDIKDEKVIIAALKSADRNKLYDCIGNIFNEVLLHCTSQRSIQMMCVELINIVNRIARESLIDAKTIYVDEDIPYEEMKKYETINEVKEWIESIYEKLLRLLEISAVRPDYTDPTKKAVEFIYRNYGKNISLNEAAEHIGVSSSYLSRVFKKDCSKGFNEYLNHVRVEHAKWLIESNDYKLKDIAKMVGFNNYTYFFTVFKDFVGMTPQEYEDIIIDKIRENIRRKSMEG